MLLGNPPRKRMDTHSSGAQCRAQRYRLALGVLTDSPDLSLHRVNGFSNWASVWRKFSNNVEPFSNNGFSNRTGFLAGPSATEPQEEPPATGIGCLVTPTIAIILNLPCPPALLPAALDPQLCTWQPPEERLGTGPRQQCGEGNREAAALEGVLAHRPALLRPALVSSSVRA